MIFFNTYDNNPSETDITDLESRAFDGDSLKKIRLCKVCKKAVKICKMWPEKSLNCI